MLSSFSRLLLTMLFLVFSQTVSLAQLVPGTTNQATATQSTALPDPLTPESVRQLVSKLSDSQVRDLLLQRLDAVAKEKTADSANDQSGIAVMVNALAGVGISVSAAIIALPTIGSGLAGVFDTFMGDRGALGFFKFLALVAIAVGLGFVANWVVDMLTRTQRERIQALNPEGLKDSVRALLIRSC